jgi:ATP-dependent Clp protease ATP-binding subunit ClpC
VETVIGVVLLILAIVGTILVLNSVVSTVRRWARRAHAPHPTQEPEGTQADPRLQKVREAAAKLSREYMWLDADVLEQDSLFKSTVADLSRPEVDASVALKAAKSSSDFEAAIGFAALAARAEIPSGQTDWTLRALRRCSEEIERFVFRMLARHAEYPVIGPTLNLLDELVNWPELAQFIAARRAAGEEITAETFRRNVPRRLAPSIENLLDRFEDELGLEFRLAFDDWRATTVDTEFLQGFARVWERPFDRPPALLVGRRRELVELVLETVEQVPGRSALLVGEAGVGKTALARAAVERLPSSFLVFEATAAQMHAGAVYVGQLETKVAEVVENLKQHRAIWHFPAFHNALHAGQHSRSPQGLLDALLPAIESGDITLIAETTPAGLAMLLAERPGLSGMFNVIQIRPLDETESLQVARHALENSGLGVFADEQTLRETFELAQQFLPTVAAPGNMLRLTGATAAETAEQSAASFETSDVLATIAASSGLPLAMLDPNEPLDLDRVREFFTSRVLGQPEAVDAIVERVAMAKAGVTNPTRPLGVFLFVGPTGTGKTEIAKALAEFMFGSPSRLVRLDMSEFQTPESLDRPLADTNIEGRGASLISSVRKDPFAVVLLDEFEKAAAPIWDLFLQVFDDGRLTDQQGRVADFRRCVIVLTSNVGSAISIRRGVGFASEPEQFRPGKVLQELKRSFRPEFLNRIDRVVVFQPFERAQMRALLDKELRDVLERRGLRGRPWAVELDESAYAFLVEKGFTPELGARPLKRAVEQHLLAPLAAAIVEQNVPEGEQFLLVSASRETGIAVTFVDPDAGVPEPVEAPEPAETVPANVKAIALTPRADPRTTKFLLDQLSWTAGAIRAEDIQDRKRAALDAVNAPQFWERDDRFETLASAEYLDRLEAALHTAERLGERLARAAGRNGEGTSELVGLLANRLHVLDAAVEGIRNDAPEQVFLRVRPAADKTDETKDFTGRLAMMYTRWADSRGMRIDHLEAPADEHLFAVTGLGSGEILMPENGLHVMEIDRERPDGEHNTERVSAVAQVASWAPGPERNRGALAELARSALEETSVAPTVVRRYRLEPAPLVRDAQRGYRTGRVDRVLAGDFDLF